MGYYFYYILKGADVQPNIALFFFPLLLALMGLMGLGFGMVISAISTKYRDFQHLVLFGVQLAMYVTPVIYPLSFFTEKESRFIWIIKANPMTGIIETFRYSFLGAGTFDWKLLTYSAVFTVLLFIFGLLVFNRTEKNFMDTV